MKAKRRNKKASSFPWRYLSRYLIILFLLIGLLIGTYGVLNYSTRKWVYNDPYRLLVSDGVHNFAVLEVLPDPVQIGVIQVPADVMIDVFPIRYGEYRLGALKELGDIENLGDELVIRSLSQALGMIIDNVIYMKSEVFEQDVSDMVSSNIVKQLILSKTNLFDAYRLLKVLASVDSSQIRELSLETLPVYVEEESSDFLSQRRLNRVFLKEYLNDWQPVLSQHQQDIQLMVTNGTGYHGLAVQYGNLLEREGFQVIGVFDSDEKIEKSNIIVSTDLEIEDSILEIIASYWGMNIAYESSESRLVERADAMVFLGTDILTE